MVWEATGPWRDWGGLKTGRGDASPRFTLLLESPLLCHLLRAPGAKRVGTGVRERKLHRDRQTACDPLSMAHPSTWHAGFNRTPTPTAVRSTGTGTILQSASVMRPALRTTLLIPRSRGQFLASKEVR